ncbi:MAG: hypothetical protein ABIQ16_07225, partial [Polyangiaceae bacterium]
DDIQNHEADVAAIIREVERGSVRVRAQRFAAERSLRQLEQTQATLRAECKSWQERALRLRADHAEALECVRRARVAREATAAAEQSHAAQLQLFEQLCADERMVEAKLGELKQKRASLVSREARALAVNATAGESVSELETVFDRWQARVEEREAGGADPKPVRDAFARALGAEEERAQLEQELAALLGAEAKQ